MISARDTPTKRREGSSFVTLGDPSRRPWGTSPSSRRLVALPSRLSLGNSTIRAPVWTVALLGLTLLVVANGLSPSLSVNLTLTLTHKGESFSRDEVRSSAGARSKGSGMGKDMAG